MSALSAAAPLLFVECQAPRSVLRQWAARRERDPQRVSDADAAVVMHERVSWEPLDEVPAGAHLALRHPLFSTRYRFVDAPTSELLDMLDPQPFQEDEAEKKRVADKEAELVQIKAQLGKLT